jgi:hypothetical protein
MHKSTSVRCTSAATSGSKKAKLKVEDELILRANDVVVVKAVSGVDVRYWLAQLCQNVCRRTTYSLTSKPKAGRTGGAWIKVGTNLDPNNVSVRYFSHVHETAAAEDGDDCYDGVLFKCDGDIRTVNVEAIHAALKKFECVVYATLSPVSADKSNGKKGKPTVMTGDIARFRISSDLDEYIERLMDEGAAIRDERAFDDHGLAWLCMRNEDDEDDGGGDDDDGGGGGGDDDSGDDMQQSLFDEKVAAKAVSISANQGGRLVRRYDYKSLGRGASAATSTPRKRKKEVVCTVCGKGDDEVKLVLCDQGGCEGACHIYCLSPPLSAVPKGLWACPLH